MVSSYINVQNILFDDQYGFRPHSTTKLALFDLVEGISTAIDNNMHKLGVFIDLKKAFDTIDHSLVLTKLCFYGIRSTAYNLIENYLSDR